MKLIYIKSLTITLLASALIACGGGGSSTDPNSPSQATVNADAAFTSVITKGVNFSLHGSDSTGTQYSGSVAFIPQPEFLQNGIPIKSTVQRVTISVPGNQSVTADTTLTYSTNPASILESRTATTKTIFTRIGDLPTVGNVGTSGDFATGPVFPVNSVVQTGNVKVTWSIEANSNACLAITNTTMVGTVSSVEKDCFRLDNAGNIVGYTVALNTNGVDLTFSN